MMQDEAVSETLGSILMYAIVFTGIALILLYGGSTLDTAKAQNNFKGIEHGFTVLYSDLEEAALDGTPVKTMRMQIVEGNIRADSATNRLVVTYNGNTYDKDTGSITYQSDRDMSAISLECGGLWKTYGSNTDVCVLKPRIYYEDDTKTLFLNVVKLGGTPSSVGGAGNTNVRLDSKGTTVSQYDAPSGATVTIDLNTDYPGAWARFFEEAIPSATTSTDYANGKVTITKDGVKRLVISEHDVDIKIG
jgi:hypothetical protein